MSNQISINMDLVSPPVEWKEFFRRAPGFSVALDGYVVGGPRFEFRIPEHEDPERRQPIANWNHHEGVDRLSTRATCAQVMMALRLGMMDTFRDSRGPRMNIWVNDCDEDVCTSIFLLKHSHLVIGSMNPLLNRLVAMEDALDTTGGAYPYPADLPTLRELAWIFEPYRQFRSSGQLGKRNKAAFLGVIEDVSSRIMRHLIGGGGAIDLDTRYETMHSGRGWSLVKEIGEHARTAMFGDKIKAFISVRDRPSGADGKDRYTYTISRMSPFVPFNVERIIRALNDEEDLVPGDSWGGGNTIGGSPRVAGSMLPPHEVIRIVTEVVGG